MEHVGPDIDRLLRTAWEQSGTDVLLAVGAPPMIRIAGVLRRVDGLPPIDRAGMERYIEQVLQEEQVKRLDAERELDFAFGWGDLVRVRGNAFIQRNAPALALRLIPKEIPDFDRLGIPPVVRRLATLSQGLVLFTGPTGSGKSTSLASMLAWINASRAGHILTIEDPIEFVHEHGRGLVTQREVGVDTQSFERALRAALREDPDVILIGEMRDPESIAIALTLAETGHLVFSTLHTNDAPQALDRIADVFGADREHQIRLQLASVLTAVVAQRLIPGVRGGVTAAFEVLIANSAVRNLLREGKTRQIRNAMTMGQSDGMQTLEMDLNRLVREGAITRDVAVEKALNPAEIA